MILRRLFPNHKFFHSFPFSKGEFSPSHRLASGKFVRAAGQLVSPTFQSDGKPVRYLALKPWGFTTLRAKGGVNLRVLVLVIYLRSAGLDVLVGLRKIFHFVSKRGTEMKI